MKAHRIESTIASLSLGIHSSGPFKWSIQVDQLDLGAACVWGIGWEQSSGFLYITLDHKKENKRIHGIVPRLLREPRQRQRQRQRQRTATTKDTG